MAFFSGVTTSQFPMLQKITSYPSLHEPQELCRVVHTKHARVGEPGKEKGFSGMGQGLRRTTGREAAKMCSAHAWNSLRTYRVISAVLPPSHQFNLDKYPRGLALGISGPISPEHLCNPGCIGQAPFNRCPQIQELRVRDVTGPY